MFADYVNFVLVGCMLCITVIYFVCSIETLRKDIDLKNLQIKYFKNKLKNQEERRKKKNEENENK